MATHRLATINPIRAFPPTARVVIPTHPGPITRGNDTEDYVCGKCGNVLLEHVQRGFMGGSFIRCGQCRTYNYVPAVAGA
jgi:hypothetical protein